MRSDSSPTCQQSDVPVLDVKLEVLLSIQTPEGFVHDRRIVGAQPAAAGAVSTEGVVLHSVTGGQGPALVLLHGWPQTWWAWHAVMPPQP